MSTPSIEVLVKYECFNRRMTLPKGITLESFKNEFKKEFGDVIPPDTEFLYQKFDPRYQDWVDMTNDEEIFDGDKIRVLEGMIYISPGVIPHKVLNNKTYRIWSQVSRKNASLMKRNASKMECNGNVSDTADLLNITVRDVSSPTTKMFRLELQVPNTPSKIYLMTGTGNNKPVTVQEVPASAPPDTSNTKFEPKYFYSFTQFRCTGVNGETDLYLASDENGKVTLAKAGLPGYPNPATLFVCNQLV